MLEPAIRRIVLIGAGHTNLHVVRRWLVSPMPDVRLTLVNAGANAAYSGMLPGVLAGLYAPDRLLIDLYRLCEAAGVELIAEPAAGLNPETREVLFTRRPSIRYDVCSIGVGSVPFQTDAVQGHSGFVCIKPMPTTLERIDAVIDRCGQTAEPVRVVVAGAGAAGVEVAFGIQARISATGRRAGVTIVESQDRPLAGFRQRTSRLAARILNERSITFAGGRRVVAASGYAVEFDDGSLIDADLLLWVVGASPPPMLSSIPLQKSAAGFIRVRATLQSEHDDRVFAVGDSAEFIDSTIERAGVYAVRQGPILDANLWRFLSRQPLVAYRPQRDFLRLLSTGDGKAIMQWRAVSAHGPRWWKLKDRIDSRFMKMHEPDAAMQSQRAGQTMPKQPATPSSTMRCRGCGGKTSSRVLHGVLDRLRSSFQGDLAITPDATVVPDISQSPPATFLQSDDTALIPTTTRSQAVSVDFFPSFLDDPWLTGRIAAVHAMSDLWACGLQPTSAVAMITLPDEAAALKEERLFHLLHGAVTEFRRSGVVLTGGHTTDGDELTIGFTILGPADATLPFRKSALQPGFDLVLTKPLGTGVILAAKDQRLPVASAMEHAIRSMLRSNVSGAAIATKFGVTAATDVTGFGLAGHLSEMLDQSNASATLDLARIPVLTGAADCLARGVRSSLHADNVAAMSHRLTIHSAQGSCASCDDDVAAILFDPQTSGGLLLGVAASKSDELVMHLKSSGDESACVVGRVEA